MLLTHIFGFKVAISFSESFFALKGPKFGSQYLGSKLEFWEKNLPGAKYHHLVQNYWKRRKFEDISSKPYLILPGFLRKWLLTTNIFWRYNFSSLDIIKFVAFHKS